MSLADDVIEKYSVGGWIDYDKNVDAAHNAINEVLERAAQEADQEAEEWAGLGGTNGWTSADNIAARIRKLKS